MIIFPEFSNAFHFDIYFCPFLLAGACTFHLGCCCCCCCCSLCLFVCFVNILTACSCRINKTPKNISNTHTHIQTLCVKQCERPVKDIYNIFLFYTWKKSWQKNSFKLLRNFMWNEKCRKLLRFICCVLFCHFVFCYVARVKKKLLEEKPFSNEQKKKRTTTENKRRLRSFTAPNISISFCYFFVDKCL